MDTSEKSIIVASPRGFCAGVVRAIATVENALVKFGRPVYVLHEIVHNKHVIAQLEKKGAVFVRSLEDIPTGELCIFSAHGVSKRIEEKAREHGLRTVDATCPLVSSIHRMVENYDRIGYEIVIIGHQKHPEVEGTAGRVNCQVHVVSTVAEAEDLTLAQPERCGFVTQTTLSQDDIVRIREVLMRRYPHIRSSKSNTCYATQNRQDAVKRLAQKVAVVLVVGSKNSSNSNRLREVAAESGVPAYLIDDVSDIEIDWLMDAQAIGVTAGASAPEYLVNEVVGWIAQRWPVTLEEMEGEEKKIFFKPASLA